MKIKPSCKFIDNLQYMIKTQWNMQKKSVIFSALSTPIDAIISLFTVYLFKFVLDAVDKQSSIINLIITIGVMTTFLALFNIGKIEIEKSCIKSQWRLNNFVLRKQLDNKVMDMDYEIFTSPTGKMMHGKADAALSGENGQSVGDLYNLAIVFLSSLTGFMAYIAVLINLNWIIIVLLILSYLIDAIIGIYLEKWIQKTKNDRSVIRKKLTYIGHSTRSIDFAKDIRLYNMTAWLKKLGDVYSEQDTQWVNKVQMNYFRLFVFESILVFLKNSASYAYLIYLMIKPDSIMHIGDFYLYFAAISAFGVWLSKVVENIEKIANSNYEVSNFREFIEMPDKMNRGNGVSLPPTNMPVSISLKNVSYTYPESFVKVLDNVNLNINKGEKIAIVGTNGAGKTTLIKLICGLICPQSGQISVNGLDISNYNRDDYYKLFTALFQDFCVLPMSIEKNISLFYKQETNNDKLIESIDLAGLSEKTSSLPNGFHTNLMKNIIPDAVELSGGEMQKLLLARAIYKEAPILILDEPTASLDPLSESDIYLKYNEMARNKTALFISHRLSSTKFCDRIIFLDNSKVIEQGTHDELMQLNGKYAEMFNVQSFYYKKELQKKVAEL